MTIMKMCFVAFVQIMYDSNTMCPGGGSNSSNDLEIRGWPMGFVGIHHSCSPSREKMG